ncbi:unnamed protein product, partial [Meganyctiphanes norvegica]
VEDVYEGMHRGLRRPDNTEGNQCGIVVEQATNETHGIWTCKIYKTQYGPFVGSKDLVITVKPTQSQVSPKKITAYPGDLQEILCSVTAARPAVKITWILNGKDITQDALTKDKPHDLYNTYMTLSTLYHVFTPDENGQNIECVVVHHTLVEPEITKVPINILFAPIQKQVKTFYQIATHSDYEIRFSFSANPRPTAIGWFYGKNFQEMPNFIQIPSDNDKYSATLIDLDNGKYQVLMKVAEITDEDFGVMFKLYAANEFGEANYKIMLSMDEAPIRCPEGSIISNGSEQCFNLFTGERRNWKDSQDKCHIEHLDTAKPSDTVTVALTKHIISTYGAGGVWLDAQGDGKTFVWQRDRTVLSSTNSLWWPFWPAKYINNSHCLAMMPYQDNQKRYSNRPYASYPCSRRLRTLCE